MAGVLFLTALTVVGCLLVVALIFVVIYRRREIIPTEEFVDEINAKHQPVEFNEFDTTPYDDDTPIFNHG